MKNHSVRKVELPPSEGTRKRVDTSGRATAELINELQKRSITNGDSVVENDK